MEPFTSATTVLTVVGMAIKVGRETYSLVQDTRHASAHIQRLATELEGLYTLLATFQWLLEDLDDQNDPEISDILENLDTNLTNCIEIFVDIKRAVNPFVNLEGDAATGKLKGFIWSIFKKDDVVVLQHTLSSYKATLNVSFAALSAFYSSRNNASMTKIDENTSHTKETLDQIKGNDARINHQLEIIYKEVRHLAQQVDKNETEELLREPVAQDQQDTKSQGARSRAKRMSIASYNSSLRMSLRNLESIISTSRTMSRAPTMDLLMDPNPAIPKVSTTGPVDPYSSDDQNSARYSADGELVDVEEYRAMLNEIDTGFHLGDDPISKDEANANHATPKEPISSSESYTTPSLQKVTKRQRSSNSMLSVNREHRRASAGDLFSSDFDESNYFTHPRTAPLPPKSSDRKISVGNSPITSSELFHSESATMMKHLKIADTLVDLTQKVGDWKGLDISQFGDLLLFDDLEIATSRGRDRVQKSQVFLFERILLCCLPPNAKPMFWGSYVVTDPNGGQSSERWQLKERIFMSNVVTIDLLSGTAWEDSLEITWEGDGEEKSLMLHFDDMRTAIRWSESLDWQSKISNPWRPNLTLNRPASHEGSGEKSG